MQKIYRNCTREPYSFLTSDTTFSCFYHTVLIYCSKRCQIKFHTLPNNENA